MSVTLARCAMIAFVLLPLTARGEPIKLKLAYFGSDQSKSYNMALRPFVDAVNADAQGGVTIEIHPGGTLGRDSTLQAQLVQDGTADIAYVLLGTAPGQFTDHAVIELPGLFRDMREATWVSNRLVALRLMHGYDEFHVIASLATEPEGIHTRVPIATLEDLRGKRIRAENAIEASALVLLGMSPVVLPIVKTSEAVTRGTIDGAATALGPLTDFGLGSVVSYHYFLPLGPAVRSILMSRAKFESLPQAGRDVIRKYGGEWLTERFIKADEAYNTALVEQLRSDPLRKVIFPTQSEIDVAEEAFKTVRAEWADASPHHRQLLNAVEAEILKFRSEP